MKETTGPISIDLNQIQSIYGGREFKSVQTKKYMYLFLKGDDIKLLGTIYD